MMAKEGGKCEHLFLEGVDDLIPKIEYPFLNDEMGVLIVKEEGLALLVEVMKVDEIGMVDCLEHLCCLEEDFLLVLAGDVEFFPYQHLCALTLHFSQLPEGIGSTHVNEVVSTIYHFFSTLVHPLLLEIMTHLF